MLFKTTKKTGKGQRSDEGVGEEEDEEARQPEEQPAERPKSLSLNPEDSLYLGQAYEKVLFFEDYPDTPLRTLMNEFLARVQEVFPRCKEANTYEWIRQMGLRGEPSDGALTPDPAEDIDESNWLEKGLQRGWYRPFIDQPGW